MKPKLPGHAQSYSDLGGYECYPNCAECMRIAFKTEIDRIKASWDKPQEPRPLVIHPRQSWVAWDMGNRWWAFKLWVTTLYSLSLTFDEWWSDRPWQ